MTKHDKDAAAALAKMMTGPGLDDMPVTLTPRQQHLIHMPADDVIQQIQKAYKRALAKEQAGKKQTQFASGILVGKIQMAHAILDLVDDAGIMAGIPRLQGMQDFIDSI